MQHQIIELESLRMFEEWQFSRLDFSGLKRLKNDQAAYIKDGRAFFGEDCRTTHWGVAVKSRCQRTMLHLQHNPTDFNKTPSPWNFPLVWYTNFYHWPTGRCAARRCCSVPWISAAQIVSPWPWRPKTRFSRQGGDGWFDVGNATCWFFSEYVWCWKVCGWGRMLIELMYVVGYVYLDIWALAQKTWCSLAEKKHG